MKSTRKTPAALQSVADYWLLCALAERDPAAAGNALAALGENSVGTEKVKYGPRLMEGLDRSDGKRRCQSTCRFQCRARGAGETGSAPTR